MIFFSVNTIFFFITKNKIYQNLICFIILLNLFIFFNQTHFILLIRE